MTFDQNGYNDMPEDEREALDVHEQSQRQRDLSRTWGNRPLESSRPHVIVDSTGQRVRPLPQFPPFPNRIQATRTLHLLQRRPSPLLLGDPRTWRVEPLKETMGTHGKEEAR